MTLGVALALLAILAVAVVAEWGGTQDGLVGGDGSSLGWSTRL